MKDLPLRLAVIYARFSTDKQDARSIEDQVRRCRAFAAAHGLRALRVYEDSATSGSHIHRPGLQAMLAAARAGEFEVVLVDDLSRLSRNDYDFNGIVFEQLPALEVSVVDVSSGGSSGDEGARMHFKVAALFNSLQLDQIRRQTHRGLEGRALAGFATGGKTYGYSTQEESNPPDPQRVRKVYVVVKEEARIVVRIFEMYAQKLMGLRAIASALNTDCIPAPGDLRRGNKRHGPGWGASTVRNILTNRRYLGELAWNVRKHVRTSEAKSRRAKRNPPERVITTQRPDLAIVPQELWDAVQARFAMRTSHGNTRGRPLGSARNGWHLLGGVLQCGECGYSYGMTGSRWKNGVRYATVGCNRARVRGPESCGNAMLVAEKKANEAVVEALRATLLDPTLLELVREGYRERIEEAKRRPSNAEVAQVEADLREVEARVRNLTEAVAKDGLSEVLSDALKAEVTRRSALRDRRAALLAKPRETGKADATTPAAVEALIERLFKAIEEDPKTANDILRKHAGSVIMTPTIENPRGFWASGVFDFGSAEKGCCGGRI
ncbi:MAG: recombinase family protein [Myxococcaceae bacterium]|nr:recombinase family protein [Myxococcaceae bacterium]